MSDQLRPTPSLEDLDDLEERIKDGQPIGIGNVLDIARDMRRESDARAERIAELEDKCLPVAVFAHGLQADLHTSRSENAKLREALGELDKLKPDFTSPEVYYWAVKDIIGKALTGKGERR